MKSRNKFTRVLATLLVLVLLLGTLPMTALASESPAENEVGLLESASLAETEAGLRPQIAPAAMSITGGTDPTLQREGASFSDITAFITEMDLDRQQTSSPNLALDANLILEANYVAQTASMLSMAVGAVDMDDVPGSEVVEVMVWLQELPAVLERIYQREGISDAALSAVAADAAAARSSIKSLMAQFIHFEYSELFAGFAIKAPMSQVRLIADMPGVFAVTRMVYYELNDELPIYDPDYNTPGNLEMREYTRIGELHALGIDGTGVKVGVIDSGLDYEHPEFAHNYKSGWNFLQQRKIEENTGEAADELNHGTHVAGTIASGGIISLGVAPNADLYIGQVFGRTGPGGSGGAESVVMAAMEAFAGARPETGLPKVDVVNMSLGVRSPDANSAYMGSHFARNNLVLAGVTVVNSAGNSATERNAGQRQPYTTTSSNAALSIAVASSQFGSTANWMYKQGNYEMRAANSNAKLSGLFLNNDFGRKEPATFTLNAGNADYLANLTLVNPVSYYGTYTIQPLKFVEGKGYEIVYVNNNTADSTEAQVLAWRNANPVGSMEGKILAFNRGIGFGVMYGEALRTGAGGVIMLDRDPTHSGVNMTIGNAPANHVMVFQTGVTNRQALLDLRDEDGLIFFDPSINGRISEDAPKEQTGHSSVGPTMENAHIKPDITAAGASILSTFPTWQGSYAAIGGTSMSSPFVAGTAALLIQYLRETGQDDSPAVVKARLMNTADPYLIGPNTSLNAGDPNYYYNASGTESSVYEHGSGFVNIWRAIHEDVWITVDTEVPTGEINRNTMDADMASFNFGEVDRGESASLTATVKGLSDFNVEVTYNHDTRYSNKNLDFAVTVDVVKEGNTFTATVNVDENANNDKLNDGNLYEGYIFVKSGDDSYVLPWAVRVPHVDPPIVLPDPGTSENVKITLIAAPSLSVYTPTIGGSMWFDASNRLYDLFMSDDGVELAWMNANCLRVPTSAFMGGLAGHLLMGQTASIVMAPDTYDILTPVYQNTNLFIAAGSFRAVQEYEFLAGYEYVFTLAGNPGGNPMISMTDIKAFDAVTIVPGDSPNAKLTIVVPAGFTPNNVGIATYIDRQNILADQFWGPWGGGSVNFGWMADNGIMAIPPAAISGAYADFQRPGQTFSVVLEPDTYDIFPLWRQSAATLGLFADAGWRINKEYKFEAGWEYILTLGLAGNPTFNLEVVPFNVPPPQPGTSANAKVTIVSHNINFATPIDVAAFLAAGGTMPPVNIAWLQANALAIPASAIQFMTGSFLPRGQSASAVITPGSYDFLPLWNQGTGLGNFGGEFGGINTLAFEAGWEYIFTADLVGGAIIFRLEKVPFDHVPDFDGVTRITLNVPTDRWGDGSGNQMWFDYDGGLFAAIAGGLPTSATGLAAIEAMTDYSIPTNARLLPNGGAHGQGLTVRPFNSATITIPAGRYDYMTTNPDGFSNWLVSNANGLSSGEQFAFEANKHYTFTVVAVGINDGVTLSVVDFIPEDVEIEVVAFDIAKPIGMVRNVVVPVSGEGFSGTVTWAPADARFAWDTAYTATVALTADAGFVFADNVAVNIAGARNVALTNEGKSLSFALDASTTARPDTARILAINESWLSHTMDFPEFNLVAFDATLTAAARLAAGGSVNLVNDFDHFVPEDFLEEMMIFRWNAINENFPAGTYDWIWYTQSSAFGNFIDDYGTVTIEAGKTYIFYLNEDWEVSITECLHDVTKVCGDRSVAATCEHEGKDVYVCVVCDYIVEEKVLDALGHDYKFTVVSSSMNLQNSTRVTITITITCERTGCNHFATVSEQVTLKQNGTQTVKIGGFTVTVVVNSNNKITDIFVGAPPPPPPPPPRGGNQGNQQ